MYRELRDGLHELARPAAEQEAAQPAFVCMSQELLDFLDWPLEALENLGCLAVIEPATLDQLERFRKLLIGLASSPRTDHLESVRSGPEWEHAREEARRILRECALPELDEAEVRRRLNEDEAD